MPKIFTHVYSDETRFHWTIWGTQRIPLLETKGVFQPIVSIEDNLTFCDLLLHLLELRLKPQPEFVDAPAIEDGEPYRVHVKGYQSRLSYSSWMTIVMSPDKIDIESHRNAVLRTIAALKAGHR